jgi:hypothetical protein
MVSSETSTAIVEKLLAIVPAETRFSHNLSPPLKARDVVFMTDRSSDRQAESLLRIGQVFAYVAPLQDMAAEEPEGGDLGDDGTNSEPPVLQEEQVVAPELGRRDPIEARACVRAKRCHRGRRGVRSWRTTCTS